MNLSVREIEMDDIPLITAYWLNATTEHLLSMGAIKELVPPQQYWQDALAAQIQASYPDKQSYCTIWLMDGQPIGHCNVNKIIFGTEAYMHLHIWQPDRRKAGIGSELVRQSLPCFFHNLQLQLLYCEPYALNPAPNKTLRKTGFEFVKEYVTIPGSFSFEQPTNKWMLSKERFQEMQ